MVVPGVWQKQKRSLVRMEPLEQAECRCGEEPVSELQLEGALKLVLLVEFPVLQSYEREPHPRQSRQSQSALLDQAVCRRQDETASHLVVPGAPWMSSFMIECIIAPARRVESIDFAQEVGKRQKTVQLRPRHAGYFLDQLRLAPDYARTGGHLSAHG